MEREITINVGVLAEKRRPKSQWIDAVWVPVAVLAGEAEFAPGSVVLHEEGFTRYFMGHAAINCHAAECEAYAHNLDSAEPALYVVLRADEGGPLPFHVHMVTASPYLAQDIEDTAEDIVERVAIPYAIMKLLADFVDAHHVEQKFKKRKRQEIRLDEQKFGKEPIFANGRGNTGNDHDA